MGGKNSGNKKGGPGRKPLGEGKVRVPISANVMPATRAKIERTAKEKGVSLSRAIDLLIK